MRQGKNQNKVDIPEEVREFAKQNWKKFKKKNKDFYESKKEMKADYYESLLYDLPRVIDFILRKGHIQDQRVQEVKNACYTQLAGENGPDFTEYISKVIKEDGIGSIKNIELLPIILYDIIRDIMVQNAAAREENPDAAQYDFDDLWDLSHLILKKRLKKFNKKGIPDNIAFDVLSIIPCKEAMKYSPFFRVKVLFDCLYTQAKSELIDFPKIIELLISEDEYDFVITYALQERKDKYAKFTEQQKILFNNITEWVLNTLEDENKDVIRAILKKYVEARKRDKSQGKDSNRRYYLSTLPESVYPKITKSANKIKAEDAAAKEFI